MTTDDTWEKLCELRRLLIEHLIKLLAEPGVKASYLTVAQRFLATEMAGGRMPYQDAPNDPQGLVALLNDLPFETV